MFSEVASLPSAATHASLAPMRLFVTGGTGVLGRALLPMALATGHEVVAPRHTELDLFDAGAVADAVRDADVVLHLATRIPSLDQLDDPGAWRENDRLREEASAILVDAALAARASVYVVPSVTFVYPDGPADEDTAVGEVSGAAASALVAEHHARRFTGFGRRGVILRLGLLDGPGTGHDEPLPVLGATVHVGDAARALLAALTLPAGVYNVCRDFERVSNARLSRAAGWRPMH
jgi:nucleoside-diphosphate-sugar epimerase